MATPGYYSVSPHPLESHNPREILFTRLDPPQGEVPEDQLEIMTQTQSILAVMKLIFPTSRADDFSRYYQQLLSYARVGVTGAVAQPAFAQKLLIGLKSEVVANEAGAIKNRYMRRLGLWALLGAATSSLAGLLIYSMGASWHADTFETASYFYVLTGTMAGVWLSFGIRKVELEFDELHIPERDRMEPLIRLVFSGLLATIIALVLSRRLVVISVGDFELADFQSDIYGALLVGALLGVSELALPAVVVRHASQIIDSKTS